MKDAASILVTTGDLKRDYDIVGPVYFQVSNRGIFSSSLSTLVKKYQTEILKMKRDRQLSQEKLSWDYLYGEWSFEQNEFDKAFYVAARELKARAAMLDADAIIYMRQNFGLATDGSNFFYLQMYGTAVRFK